MISVLFVDDDKLLLSMVTIRFGHEYEVFTADSAESALELLEQEDIDLVVTDMHMSGMSGIDMLKRIKEDNEITECILMSAQSNVEISAEAIRLGAADYFKKPLDIDRLNLAILKAGNTIALRKRLRSARLAQELAKIENDSVSGLSIIGSSTPIIHLKKQMVKAAKTSDTSVLIIGESGTGKELVAKGIHELSTRSKYNFIAVNMSAVPEQLFESEFFGHKKGAFTGAVASKPGWFELAQNGTLFLDEIGEMPLQQQAKLLRVIESRQYTPVGGQSAVSFDVRIIAATNRLPDEMSSGDEFRMDLYHRLSTLEMHLPPLRERRGDIVELVQYFVAHFSEKHHRSLAVEESFYVACEQYPFPGNIRELRNCIERAVIMAEGKVLKKSHLSFGGNAIQKSSSDLLPTYNLAELEALAIRKALDTVNGNKSKAAELLGIKWNALHRKMVKYGIKQVLKTV